MSEYWVPKFQYPATTGTLLTLTTSQRPWTYRDPSVGGYRDSAAGVRAAYVIRRNNRLEIVLRVYESERAAVKAMIEYMQEHPQTACTWWPDVTVTGTSYSILLREPVIGGEIVWEDSGFPGLFETRLVIEKSNNAAWSLDYYG